MNFLDRHEEMQRLVRLGRGTEGALAIVYGRRRIGKTRLLLEWVHRSDGVYAVADLSSPSVQRRYLADVLGARLPGFGDVEYRDWRSLLSRLAREARAAGWRGPLVLDELPYLVVASPELPSVLQQWVDHEAKESRLVVALAGSSQRMMQGLVLSRGAPLYGRANEILAVGPLPPQHLWEALHPESAVRLVEAYAAWGGVPRYWELAANASGSTAARLSQLVLDPLGPLHREPDHVLLEEIPSALEVRPVLDAIGGGAHRVSEIGARIGRAATSLSRPLERLVEMGLVRREVPFGESERKSRRTLYTIDDPFFRLWFRVVAPQRGFLATASPSARLSLLRKHWPALAGAAWEELCRRGLGRLKRSSKLGRLGPWGPAGRWWHGNLPEWDVVAESLDGRRLLLGEAKWSAHPLDPRHISQVARELVSRAPPESKGPSPEIVRALFVPEAGAGVAARVEGAIVVTAADFLSP